MIIRDDRNVKVILADYDVQWMMQAQLQLGMNSMIKVVGLANSGEIAINRVLEMGADALIINYGMPDMSAKDIMQRISEQSPTTIVIAISSSLTANLIAQAKSMGIAEIFHKETLNFKELADFVVNCVEERRRQLIEAADRHGVIRPQQQQVRREVITLQQAIILVHSPKGGVGKSTVSSNIALAIKKSPILSGQRVAILDFDCTFGNLATIFALSKSEVPSHDLSRWEYMTEAATLEEVDELLMTSQSGVKVLPAPISPAIAERINEKTAERILNILKRYYQYIVIDGGPKISPLVDVSMEYATHIILLTTPEGQSAENIGRVVYAVKNTEGYDYLLRKMMLVLNRVNKNRISDLTPKEVADIVGLPVFEELPEDDVVPRAINQGNGRQAIEIDPNAPFSIAIKRLTNTIVPGSYMKTSETAEKMEEKEKKQRRGIFGFLR
ncbi:MAG: AAA family ATPase [Thermovenabulum sp.]|uniref:nucleotide-binding protein n=1 Tax=Thermovenabulum sp. TaxID=3100335 RepID=UPI003C7DAB69